MNHNPGPLVAPALLIGSNVAAFVHSTVTGHIDATALAAGVTAVSLAALGAVKLLTPAVADAIKTIGPALAEVRKQREEMLKGSLTHQIESLEANQVKMRDSLHDIRDRLHRRELEVQSLSDDLHVARADTATLSAQLTEANRQLLAANERIAQLQQLGRQEHAETQQVKAIVTEVRDTLKGDPGLNKPPA